MDLCNNPITTAGGKELLDLVKENQNIQALALAGTSIHRLITNCICTEVPTPQPQPLQRQSFLWQS